MSEVEFKKPHEWARDAEGHRLDAYESDEHGGPECLNCGPVGCQWCRPEMFTEACPVQDPPAIPIKELLTEVQLKVRAKELRKLGYILRNGEVVGKGEPLKPCKPTKHKLRVIDRKFVGHGPQKRAYITSECVVCLSTFVGP